MKQPTEQLQIKKEEDVIDLMELFSFYLSKAVYIIIALLIGAIAAGAYTVGMVTPQYTATSKLYMVSASTGAAVDLTDLNIGTSLSEDYQILMRIRPIFEEVIDELDLEYDYETLGNMVSIGAINKTRVMAVSVTSPDPEEAMNIANAIADKAVTYLPVLMETPEPNIAEYAILPTQKSSPSVRKNVMMGGLAMMVLCVGILTILFLKDDTLKNSDDVERVFGVMPLSVIPEGSNLADSKMNKAQKKRKGGK